MRTQPAASAVTVRTASLVIQRPSAGTWTSAKTTRADREPSVRTCPVGTSARVRKGSRGTRRRWPDAWTSTSAVCRRTGSRCVERERRASTLPVPTSASVLMASREIRVSPVSVSQPFLSPLFPWVSTVVNGITRDIIIMTVPIVITHASAHETQQLEGHEAQERKRGEDKMMRSRSEREKCNAKLMIMNADAVSAAHQNELK